MRHRSKRKEGEWREYVKKRNKYLNEHPNCEVCKKDQSESLHHKRHRGKYLCVEEYFLATCSRCHSYIHNNPKEAYEKGLLLIY